MAIMKDIFFWGSKNARIERGANFCQVDKIRHEVHETEAITEGYQKWHGTLPSFSKIAVVSMSGMIFGREENDIHSDVLDISNKADPRAWARKYFTDPSVSWLFFLCIIMGVNLRRFSSMAAHRRIQFVLDRAIRVLRIRDVRASIIVGE
jgi:hypothetical protein